MKDIPAPFTIADKCPKCDNTGIAVIHNPKTGHTGVNFCSCPHGQARYYKWRQEAKANMDRPAPPGGRPSKRMAKVAACAVAGVLALILILVAVLNNGCVGPNNTAQASYIIDTSPKPVGQPQRAYGNSMAPVLFHGSWYYTVPTPYSSLQVGMIVIYEDPLHNLNVHQLIHRQGDNYIAKGLNNTGPDLYPVTRLNYRAEVLPCGINPLYLKRI